MPKMTVYRFRRWSNQIGDYEAGARMGTLDAIKGLGDGFSHIEASGVEIDDALLDKWYPGLTGRNFTPVPRPSGTDPFVRETPMSDRMRIYFFRCSNKSDLRAISLDPNPASVRLHDTLPANKPPEWMPDGDAEVEPGDAIDGFNSAAVFRDLDAQGFHTP